MLVVALNDSDIYNNTADYTFMLAKNSNDAGVFITDMIDLLPIFKMLPSDRRTKNQ
jgi:hypothetical protein